MKGRRQSNIGPADEDVVGNDDFEDEEDIDLPPEEIYKRPDDQEKLTEEQKNEVFTKTITAADPNVATTITRFDYTEGEFKVDSALDHLAVHFVMLGDLIDRESDEARRQIEYAEMKLTGKVPKKKKSRRWDCNREERGGGQSRNSC